eukprot:TRINITY_DN3742_c2_g1_i1.p1 TRINITY_DN3742_c2_g1~~TRINITY_DN3742_c2_g1_i1.p1  ORF type:complete len:475 (+),score=72.66 TRINITY_DN3742_c2_g1_i1:97-1425(+)
MGPSPELPKADRARVHQKDAGPSVAVLCDGVFTMFRPGRVFEVISSMPIITKIFLVYTLVVDVLVVVSCFVKHGSDQDVFQRLIIVYASFHYVMAFHSVYTQNEYTLVAALMLVLVETLFVTLDWRDTFTGYKHTAGEIAVHWVGAFISLCLSVAVYKSAEGFGWRPYRELGALADSLAIHQAYRSFTAALSCDLFAAVMQCTLAWNLVSWPVWFVVLNAIFGIVMPVLLFVPLRKSVKHEWMTLLKGLVAMYAVGWGIEVTAFVQSVMEQVGPDNNSRLLQDTRFPIGGVLMAATGTAVIVRLVLVYRLYRVVVLAKGKGLLKELGARRSMHRDVIGTSSGYGTIRSFNSEEGTRYDFQYRVERDNGNAPSTSSLPLIGERSLSLSQGPVPASIGVPPIGPASTGILPSAASSPSLPMGATPSLGPVPIVTAKAVALNGNE